MHITKEMIHPSLRKKGLLLRALLPYFNDRTFLMCNRAQRLMKGMHSKKLQYEQIRIDRPDAPPENQKLRICVYSPKERRQNVPGLLWIHGGGYAIGTPEQDEGFIRAFVEESGCIVAAPDYCLSTSAPYPAALNDCYAALLWLRDNAASYGIRTDQLMVGGDSAGGGLAAALCIYARDKGTVSISFQMPLYPMLDDRMITESSIENDAPIWNTKSNINAWKRYLGSMYQTDSVPAYAAPARLTDYSHLPPAFTFVGGIEPFRDEAVSYIEKLHAAGIPAECHIYDGCFHAFDLMGKRTGIAREARALLLENFRYAIAHYFAPQPDNTFPA